jgi:hypothetical protein
VNTGSTTRTAYGPAVRVDNNAWHHVVVVFDRDVGIIVYVDGAVRTTNGAITSNLDNQGEFLVGKSDNWFSPYFKGDLDELALYKKVLTATRVQAHLNKGRGI